MPVPTDIDAPALFYSSASRLPFPLFPASHPTPPVPPRNKPRQVCATLEEACAALDACSPAPAHLRDFLPGERTLFPLTHSTMVAALSERRVWALPGPDGKPVAVLAGATTPRGMAIASVAAASPAGLEAALVAARLHLPRACRFYILAGCDPLRLMGDQFSITQIWERAAGHLAS